MKKSTIITASVIAVLVGAGGISIGVASMNQVPQVSPSASTQAPEILTDADKIQIDEQTAEVVQQQPAPTTDDLLLYLIEEEKLAHDVYTVLSTQWGGNTFTNILASETTHQDMVLGLLTSYGLEDPRSQEIGVFTNPDLQALYDQLVAQGMTSQTEAYKVGVLIEETDITDLTSAINSTSDGTIISVLEKLRSASESHLAAFSKKL
ncbi:hypothetical protein M2119_001086 [Aurantimicrobium minutum]|uniref:DUF2202 domain-containing protein n=1 Tax=Aurantimicrobium minutum TaxID=708131 RepID=UPI002473EE01|nr:DUF2202 domain-containing protein [Aurantimicrobium minutum]MDH6532849.1 hypothetical protein [Aurantimicrobium minutum]